MFRNGSGNGLLIAGGVILILAAAGVYLATRDDGLFNQGDVTAVVAPSAPAVVSGTSLPAEPVGEGPQPPQGTAEDSGADADVMADQAVPPSFDEVRVDASGAMVIAGRANPGARVDVLVDGEVVASSDADALGAFAVVGLLDQSDGARLLTLRTGVGDSALVSGEEIILAPVAGAPAPLPAEPQAVAEAAEVEDSGKPPASGDDIAEAEAIPAPAPVAADVAALPNPPEQTVQSTDLTPSMTAQAPAEEAEEETAVSTVVSSQQAAPEEPSAPEETSEVAVLRSDEAGVTLIPAQPQPTQTVVLDTIGYTDEGTVQLGGRAETGTIEVRAYLDNRAVARLPVDAQGNWRGEVPQVDAGVYTLRVDALSADGSVASRIETPFKREEPAVLAAAVRDSDGPVRAVTVQAGDTLWAIARDRYGEGLLYVQVFEANRSAIRNPDLIYPGQVFELPAD